MKKPVILCVDDERMVLISLKDQLMQYVGHDYVIEIAESGEEAIEVIEELLKEDIEIPLIISDQIMPGIKGDELLIKIHDRYPSALKVFLTGQADAHAVGNAVNRANLYRYISKPWDEADLKLTITEALYSYSQDKQISQQNKLLESLYIQAQGEIAERKRIEALLAEANESLRKANEDLERRVEERTAELSKANKDISKAAEEWKKTFDSVPDLIMILDKQHRIVRANKAAADRLSLTPKECLGRYCYELVHGTETPPVFCPHSQLLDDIREHKMEAFMDHMDGDFIVTTSPLFDSDGNLFGSVHVSRDITDRKRAEQELLKAKDAAEVATRIKSEFLANMSHEIRTPLNAILGYAQFLQKDPAATEFQRDRLKIIHKSGDHLLSLLNDILDLSKVEAGRIEIQPGIFSLADFLNFFIEMFQPRAHQKNIGFYYEFSDELPNFVKGDEVRTRQVIINLLGNAVKFTEKGSVTFKADYHNGHIFFEVRDTGPGIETCELENIFAPFRQAARHTGSAEGTGLGLTISRKLVELMGGKLTVQSTPGEGSVFRVGLELPEADSSAVIAETRNSAVIGYTGAKRRVLIADDVSENRFLLTDLLVSIGFEVIEADDGLMAVEKAEEWLPDVIFMDLFMPRMNGFEAVRRIRADLPHLQTVIFAVSAGTLDEHIRKSREAGCNDFIPKPITIENIIEKLKQHLDIEWIYAQTISSEKNITCESAALIEPPSPKELENLMISARIGDIETIRQMAEKLIRQDKQFIPFAVKLNQLAKDFQIGKIRNFLKSFIDEKDA
jgi:PAS domain S-box-containing protein